VLEVRLARVAALALLLAGCGGASGSTDAGCPGGCKPCPVVTQTAQLPFVDGGITDAGPCAQACQQFEAMIEIESCSLVAVDGGQEISCFGPVLCH
jgi:hypothetical protein